MSKITLPICVTLKKTGTVLLQATNTDQVIRFEGNWYFSPQLMDKDKLKITDRLYHCAYKGTANWIDLESGTMYIPDVAWVYPQTLPGYEHIAGWIGFYPETVHYKTGACEP
jgi:uncharacterized protein (DUF427 family)